MIDINKKILWNTKKFLDEIKELLSYFVEFSKNESILFKKYYKNQFINRFNKWSIIINIYNKKIFLANNKY